MIEALPLAAHMKDHSSPRWAAFLELNPLSLTTAADHCVTPVALQPFVGSDEWLQSDWSHAMIGRGRERKRIEFQESSPSG